MPVLDRSELEASPLADLHALANELGIDGYRLLRREELVEAIVGDAPDATSRREEEERPAPARRSAAASRSGVSSPSRSRRERSEGRLRRAGQERGEERDRGEERERRERTDARAGSTGEGDAVEGVVELLDGGSAFLRLHPPAASDDDPYISPAQVKRCELRSGDRVSGPIRRARRRERYPSLARVDTINGVPADEAVKGPAPERGRSRQAARPASFDEGHASFPTELIDLRTDATLAEVQRVAPLGYGSRTVVVGPPRSGKTRLVRAIHDALRARGEAEVTLVLLGVRPEEIADWNGATAVALPFTASPDVQGQALERVLADARRRAAAGARPVVLIDTLEGLHQQAARKALACARHVEGAGSLTVIGTASRPYGGETTVVALDGALAAAGRWPALDVLASGTLRAERLVGEHGAREIARAHAHAQRSHSPGGIGRLLRR